jgi:hypothetical protein
MTGREGVARFVPGPLAVLALLLAVLIILTPVLLSNGQPVAGSILTQADLIVDRTSGINVTNFYVRGVGITTRYSAMSIEVATGFNWTGSFPSESLHWVNATSGVEVLTLVMNSSANPIAVSVSALYQQGGGSALYVGVFAFDLVASPSSSSPILYAVTTTSGVTVGYSTPVSNLPLIIPLANVGGGP